MRGVYTASIKITGLASAKTLWHLVAPADKVVEILSAVVSNASNETNEQLELTFQRSTDTPTGTAITPAKHEAGDQAAGSTVKGNATVEPTYTANTELGYEGAASLGSWRFDPIPEERPIVPGQGGIGLRCLVAPSSFNAIVRVTFREIG